VERLRWQCRRGMLELDYLLEEFLEQQFESLDSSDQSEFVRLLGEADQDLQRWLVLGMTPADAGFARLIEKLLHGRHPEDSPVS
jgi:antitoxin CptB